jgi:hypothetical protein
MGTKAPDVGLGHDDYRDRHMLDAAAGEQAGMLETQELPAVLPSQWSSDRDSVVGVTVRVGACHCLTVTVARGPASLSARPRANLNGHRDGQRGIPASQLPGRLPVTARVTT